MDQLTENEESIKSSKIYFYAAPTSFALGNQNIQNQSCIRSSYPRFLSCASWNAAWRLLSPPLELIQYILPLTRKLYLNYGLSNSLNMFIFLFLALGLVHRKLIFTDSHSFLKRCFLQTSLSFFFFFDDGLIFFVLCLSVLTFFCMIRSLSNGSLSNGSKLSSSYGNYPISDFLHHVNFPKEKTQQMYIK